MGFKGVEVIIFWSQSLYAPDYTLFVDLNDIFSCQEFDGLLCKWVRVLFSPWKKAVKWSREIGMSVTEF